MKTKLFSIITLIGITAFSQTLTTFKSDASTGFSIVTSASNIDQTLTGVNTSWTFNDLMSIGTNIDTYSAPTTEQLTTYPGTTELLSITTQDGTPQVNELYLKEDNSGSFITGISLDDLILNYSVNHAFLGLFPLNYGDSNTGDVSGIFSFQGQNGTFTGIATTTVDAYGTLNITNSTGETYNGNVTRLRLHQTLSFNVLFVTAGTLTQTTYYYYDNTANNIVFRSNSVTIASTLLDVNETAEIFEYNEDYALSTNPIEAPTFKLHSNPVKDYITINLQGNQIIKSIKIIDVLGKEVFIQNKNATTLSVSHLNKGIYFIILETKTGTLVKKFLKQ